MKSNLELAGLPSSFPANSGEDLSFFEKPSQFRHELCVISGSAHNS